jgi:hypothetical protein
VLLVGVARRVPHQRGAFAERRLLLGQGRGDPPVSGDVPGGVIAVPLAVEFLAQAQKHRQAHLCEALQQEPDGVVVRPLVDQPQRRVAVAASRRAARHAHPLVCRGAPGHGDREVGQDDAVRPVPQATQELPELSEVPLRGSAGVESFNRVVGGVGHRSGRRAEISRVVPELSLPLLRAVQDMTGVGL